MNMEVQLDVGQIPNLKEFVSHLTQTMHSLVPGSLVIWSVSGNLTFNLVKYVVNLHLLFDYHCWLCRYDSVTINGDLDYQNQLNEKNKPFFDICDGIFANYSWQVFPCLYSPH